MAAVYRVTSEPAWHPVDGYQCVLQLAHRPEVSVTLDVHHLNQVPASAEGQEQELPRGVFELDVSGLEVVVNAIEDHYAGDKSAAGGLLETLGQSRMSS